MTTQTPAGIDSCLDYVTSMALQFQDYVYQATGQRLTYEKALSTAVAMLQEDDTLTSEEVDKYFTNY